jgi:hypothetical protein
MAASAAAKPAIDVVIRNLTDLEEVIVSVTEAALIREIKEILAERAERPELLEVGEILRMNPDGSTTAIKDGMKVGMKRLLGFRGCPLHPPPPERPPLSLDDFAEFDPDEDVLGSPRSVRACFLEGVGPEDLIYVPIEEYKQRGVEHRIAELWHDFFEALRQDVLRATRDTRQMLIAEEGGKLPMAIRQEGRIAGTGGNWCGALEPSRCNNVQAFFIERNKMCEIDRVYRGATKPFRPALKGSRYFSNTKSFQDEDPVLAGDNADDAAYKLEDMLHHYKRLPHSKRFVQEQTLKTEATGVVQYGMDARKMHRDQGEMRRLVDHRLETAETQIAIVDGEIQVRNETRRLADQRAHESKPPKSKLEHIRQGAIKKRAEYFAERRELVHENQLDFEYHRCDEMQRMLLHDQAVEARVHSHRNLRMLGFAREWTKQRIRWQMNNNSITANRDAWNAATLEKQQDASDRVDTQRLLRQKLIEYKKELKTLQRMYADLAAKREKARQDSRRSAVADEFARIAIEEAYPSPSPLRRKNFSSSLSSTAFSSQSMGSAMELTADAPFSHLLKQPRVVKRIARFEFPRSGSGFLSNSSMGSTMSPTSIRHSTSMPSLSGSSTTFADQRELQRALTHA